MCKLTSKSEKIIKVFLIILEALLTFGILYSALQIYREGRIAPDYGFLFDAPEKQNDPAKEGKTYDTRPVEKPERSDLSKEWKTYRNEEYGYTLDYPQDWYVYTENPAEIFLQPGEEQPGNIPGPHADALSIRVSSLPPEISLAEAIQDALGEEGNAGIKFSSEEIEIGGIKGLKIKTICEGVGCGAPEWFVIKDDHLYHFDSNLGYLPIFDQIIVTYRF